MSRSRRQRDSVAPTLFPFLAVLLCTMGALVLILMLIVAGAQTTARQTVEQAEQQVEEVQSQLQLASYAYEKRLSEGRIALEKKRLALQHLETHIQELLEELSQLQRTAELAEQQTPDNEEQESAAAISELEKQLLEATQKLKQKLDKPKGDKPIFAIIPYEGRNGTHRRPIYLECTESGIKIQPEGIALQLDDLQPPYGPGNPLDAALRTIRAEFAPANHAVTSTAYPLLIVRPSGIHAYAMARAAMSGWDDQFGYELIDEELELTFPDSQPGLGQKIAQSIELARQRQAALVMAMPRKYRGAAMLDDEPLGGGSGSSANDGGGSGGNAYAGGAGSGTGANADVPSPTFAGPGGFSLMGDQPSPGMGPSSGHGESLGFGNGVDGMPATDSVGENADWNLARNSLAAGPADASGTGGADGSSFFGGNAGTADNFGPGGSEASLAGGQMGRSEDGAAGDASAAGGSSNPSGSGGSGASGSSGSSGSGGQAMNSAGTQVGLPLNAPFSQSSATSSSFAENASEQRGDGHPTNSPSNSSGSASNYSPTPGAAGPAEEASPPVAQRRGRGWAWSQGPPSQTAVVRSIRMQCLKDRWVVLADASTNGDLGLTIPFEDSPQARAEKLAKYIADRVESWGLALGGGYWKPVLVVEVAPDAQWRFDQLKQLLDGSGLDVQRHTSPSR